MAQTEAGTKKRDIHLLGWTGDYNDPDNFLGVFFGGKTFEWGFDNKDAVRRPEGRPGAADRRGADAGVREDQRGDRRRSSPGVPLAHPAPSLAFAKGVEGYVASPVQDEVWNNVTVTR